MSCEFLMLMNFPAFNETFFFGTKRKKIFRFVEKNFDYGSVIVSALERANVLVGRRLSMPSIGSFRERAHCVERETFCRCTRNEFSLKPFRNKKVVDKRKKKFNHFPRKHNERKKRFGEEKKTFKLWIKSRVFANFCSARTFP